MFKPNETFEQMRQRLIDETARFIEWGLTHPDRVERIPRHVLGAGEFSSRVKRFFWATAMLNQEEPD
jgi:hypothetical protein